LLFLSLKTEELAIERVRTRVIEGGHNIPEPVIRRRFNGGLTNLFQKYIDIVDKWILVDNSKEKFQFIAEGGINELYVKDEKYWNELKEKYYGN